MYRTATAVCQDFETKKAAGALTLGPFDQRPYFRILLNLLDGMNKPDRQLDNSNLQVSREAYEGSRSRYCTRRNLRFFVDFCKCRQTLVSAGGFFVTTDRQITRALVDMSYLYVTVVKFVCAGGYLQLQSICLCKRWWKGVNRKEKKKRRFSAERLESPAFTESLKVRH